MSDFEPGMEDMGMKKEFRPKDHFSFEVPKDETELRVRLFSAFDAKNQGWVYKQNDATSEYLFDPMGTSTTNVPLESVVGWTYFHNVPDFLNEDRADSRGLQHVMEIINGWNGDGDESHATMKADGLTFISNEPGKYILNEGKHRFLAAVAMGIKELPARVDMYARKSV